MPGDVTGVRIVLKLGYVDVAVRCSVVLDLVLRTIKQGVVLEELWWGVGLWNDWC